MPPRTGIAILIALALPGCASTATAPVAPEGPPAGPWVMMIGVPYDPGSKPVVNWISEADVPPPPASEDGYTNRHWVLTLPQPASVDPDPALKRFSRVEYDCGHSGIQTLETRILRNDVEIRRTGAEDPRPIVPHTIEAFTANAICREGLADAAPRATDVEAARAAQAAFFARRDGH